METVKHCCINYDVSTASFGSRLWKRHGHSPERAPTVDRHISKRLKSPDVKANL